jgi:hypothetical protein
LTVTATNGIVDQESPVCKKPRQLRVSQNLILALWRRKGVVETFGLPLKSSTVFPFVYPITSLYTIFKKLWDNLTGAYQKERLKP